MNDLTPMSTRPAPRVARTSGRPPAVGEGIVLGGKYRLEAAIARGGMARIWRAMHVTLNQPVAVKFLEGVEATRTETFLREAKIAASVRNKHVVAIIDFGLHEVPGTEPEPYMVMELLDGETLDDRLRRPGMTVDEVVSIGLQVLSGLDAVHQASIVHRDMKPGNIFLTEDNEGVFARLLDFGISKDADVVDEAHLIVGTPEYMSPEQARGAPLDFRSDLYSLGVVLYEMLSGTVPFHDDNVRTVVALVATERATPLHAVRPDIPELAAVVERAMALLPADRWGSAREMRLALLEVPVQPSEPPRTSQADAPSALEAGRIVGDAPTLGVAGSASERRRFEAIVASSVGRPRARVALALSVVALATLGMGWIVSESRGAARVHPPAVTSTPSAIAALPAFVAPLLVVADAATPEVEPPPAVLAIGVEPPAEAEPLPPAPVPRRVVTRRAPAPTRIRHDLDF